MIKRHGRTIASIMLCTALALTTLTGCGSSNKKNDKTASGEVVSSKDDLQDFHYYIKKSNGTYVETYFGKATFSETEPAADASGVSSPDSTRVMWFKDDLSKIPVLNANLGDELVMKSSEQLSESFNWERFQDVGYTVGICQLTETPSHRFSVPTNSDSLTIYPDGDFSSIQDSTNDTINVDSIGEGQNELKLRSQDAQGKLTNMLSLYGTLKNLKAGSTYKFNIYDGTKKKEIEAKADIRVLGSYETASSTDFEYTNGMISIDIPEFFKTGYYLVNGVGLFRYIAKGDSENTSNNTLMKPTQTQQDTYNYDCIFGTGAQIDNGTATTEDGPDEEGHSMSVEDQLKNTYGDNYQKQNFSMPQDGTLSVRVTIDGAKNGDDNGPAIALVGGDGSFYQLTELDDSGTTFGISISASSGENFELRYYGLTSDMMARPTVQVS